MAQKKTNEYTTQYKITKRLNAIDISGDNTQIKNELRDITYGFWYKKFKKIRRG